MARNPVLKWLRANITSVEMWLLALALSGFAASLSWANEIVRAIRGEEAKEDWRTDFSIATFITFWTITTGARVRETASLRAATVEMRGLVGDAATQAELRDQRADERDRRAAEQQERMLLVNKLLLILAALTLSAAIVTLAVTIAR